MLSELLLKINIIEAKESRLHSPVFHTQCIMSLGSQTIQFEALYSDGTSLIIRPRSQRTSPTVLCGLGTRPRSWRISPTVWPGTRLGSHLNA